MAGKISVAAVSCPAKLKLSKVTQESMVGVVKVMLLFMTNSMESEPKKVESVAMAVDKVQTKYRWRVQEQ